MELKCLGIVLSVLLLMFEGWLFTDACWEDERSALLQIKPFFNYYPYYLDDWKEVNNSDCCKWNWVECNTTTRQVIALFLNETKSYEDQHWYLNASLFLPFKKLKSLFLSGNNIAGFVENEGHAKLSSKSVDLEILDLRQNYLNDSILLSLSELSSLKYLDLGLNELTGSSSHAKVNETQLGLTNLEELDLSGNLLRNNIFAFLGGLLSLKTLNMRINQLQGSIDITELNYLRNLKKLDLSSNEIESLLSFQEKGRQLRLTHLEELDLSYNLLNDSIFAPLRGLSNLKSLRVSDNRLKGSVDMNELGVFTNLEELDISGNKLSEFVAHKELHMSSILQSIGVLGSLKTLSMSHCGLIDPLPDQGWCDLRNLEQLDISGNALEDLPLCFGDFTSLRVLDISDNQFAGNLSFLANFTSLRFLSLSKNHFQVPLSFISLANLTDLKVLLSGENNLVMGPTFHTSIPKFQLNVFTLSNCTTDQKPVSLEPLEFLHHQNDLRYVDLSYNKFNGTVPFWLLDNNTKLEALFLNGNSFTDPLSFPLVPCPTVSSIDISKNKIQAQIPIDICSTFPHLKFLSLSRNAFEGNIPPCLGGMSNLTFLDLSSNHLSGGVPDELSMISSLSILRLSNNNLTGKIVPTFFNSSFLEKLYLDGNNFDGLIPDIDISNDDFPHWLFDIDLSNNSLSGKLPRWIWNLSNLQRLALSNNHFEGSIPMELCNLDQLQFLDLSQNNFSGSIPSCFNPPIITHVHLSGNRLSGPLTHSLYNSSSLVTLALIGNNFTGNIPEWIGTLSALSVLLLRANHLQGGIPIQLCKMSSLSIIDLSQNMLSGLIPSCLGNLTLGSSYDKSSTDQGALMSLSRQDISKYIQMETYKCVSQFYPVSYMEEWIEFTTKSWPRRYGGGVLDYMSGIDLSCNKLTGQIPLELGNLSECRSLNLSHNNLIGAIPSSFSNLKLVESLDLSYNNLSGRIPIRLVELNFLEVFSVAHNNLSGSTLERKAQFGTFEESCYEGNPLLCGPPLQNKCSNPDSPPPVSSASDDEEDGGLLDMFAFRVSFLISFAIAFLGIVASLCINQYWRETCVSFVEDCITTFRFSIVGKFVSYMSSKMLSCHESS